MDIKRILTFVDEVRSEAGRRTDRRCENPPQWRSCKIRSPADMSRICRR